MDRKIPRLPVLVFIIVIVWVCSSRLGLQLGTDHGPGLLLDGPLSERVIGSEDEEEDDQAEEDKIRHHLLGTPKSRVGVILNGRDGKDSVHKLDLSGVKPVESPVEEACGQVGQCDSIQSITGATR